MSKNNQSETSIEEKGDITESSSESVQPVESSLNKIQISDLLIPGFPSGFPTIDRLTKGFHHGELIVVASRPSMGKTCFVLNIAEYLALKAQIPVLYFSLEASAKQILTRLVCSNQRLELDRLRGRELIGEEITRLSSGIKKFQKSKTLYIDDSRYLTLELLSKKIKAWLQKVGVYGVIIIDYINLMSSETKAENRYQEMATISRGLKLLAKEVKCPIIAVSQLSRYVENRPDKRPILSDLRDSGTIEEDADVVIFLYRDIMYYWDLQETNKERNAEAIIRKQRYGKTGTVNLIFYGEYSQFKESIKR